MLVHMVLIVKLVQKEDIQVLVQQLVLFVMQENMVMQLEQLQLVHVKIVQQILIVLLLD